MHIPIAGSQIKIDQNVSIIAQVRKMLEKNNDFWYELGVSYTEYFLLQYGQKSYHVGIYSRYKKWIDYNNDQMSSTKLIK